MIFSSQTEGFILIVEVREGFVGEGYRMLPLLRQDLQICFPQYFTPTKGKRTE